MHRHGRAPVSLARQAADHLDEIIPAVTVPAAGANEFLDPGQHGAVLWRAAHMNAPAAPELQQAIVSQQPQRPQDVFAWTPRTAAYPGLRVAAGSGRLVAATPGALWGTTAYGRLLRLAAP